MQSAYRIVALAVVAAFLTVMPSPAVASCAAGAGPAGSPTIFLGVAGETSGGYTTMTVEEVWAGRDLPASVRVLSGQTEPNVGSSTDADLEPGHRYVIGADDKLRTNACSIEEIESTTSTEDAMSLRPDHVRRPVIGTDDVGEPKSSKPVVVAVLVLAIALSAVGVAVRVRNRR